MYVDPIANIYHTQTTSEKEDLKESVYREIPLDHRTEDQKEHDYLTGKIILSRELAKKAERLHSENHNPKYLRDAARYYSDLGHAHNEMSDLKKRQGNHEESYSQSLKAGNYHRLSDQFYSRVK
jgi:hypothetical protein